jgi:tetratricopeptide (TPR) repeat protein
MDDNLPSPPPFPAFCGRGSNEVFLSVLLLLLLFSVSFLYAAGDDAPDARDVQLMKAASMDAGRMSSSEDRLYEESIRSTKQSIARETLDVFYRDAVDFYREGRYDESLDLLNKIYSIDPYYQDVASLRDTVGRMKISQDNQSRRNLLEDFMRKGNKALADGQNVVALDYWKQALVVDPHYEPALKKIHEVRHMMAQKEFETGYLHYHHGDMVEALDNWSNAIALDPSFKQRGLLLLMAKVELGIRKDRINRLATQAGEQYEQHDLEGALDSYNELLQLDPRHEEARRMSAKIRILIGQAAFKRAHQELSKHLYVLAIKDWEKSIQYGFEIQRSQKLIQEAERLARINRQPKPKPAPKPAVVEVSSAPVVAQAPKGPPPNPEEALTHYRQGLQAFREKDFHRAVEELEIAKQLDPTNEHIYIAYERAKNAWAAVSAGQAAETP